MMTNKKITIYKIAVVLFLLLYVAFSCFPCVKISTWRGFLEEGAYEVKYTSNLSIVMAVALVLQIVLLVKNRPWLQMLAGLFGVASGLLTPLTVSLANKVDDLMCIVGSQTRQSITTVGWIVTAMSWILLALDIWLAVSIKKYLAATATSAGINTEGRDEVIK